MFHLYHKVINRMIGKVLKNLVGLLRESSIQSCSMAFNELKEIVETTAIRSSPRMEYGTRKRMEFK